MESELATISNGLVKGFEVSDMVRKNIGAVLVSAVLTWGRNARRSPSYDTDRLCDVHCDAMATARFYDRRAF
jgi:hypothetical protein